MQEVERRREIVKKYTYIPWHTCISEIRSDWFYRNQNLL